MRGETKPIEIILGIFILIVVSVMLLQLVRRFMTEQSGRLEQLSLEERRQASMENALQVCNNLCNRAMAESCSDAKVAEYCLQEVSIDYNGNGRTFGNEYGSAAGIYTCEIPVYCFQITECSSCNLPQGVQGAQRCKTRLCSFWSQQGISGDTLKTTVQNYLKPGTCLSNPELENKTITHWFILAFGNSTTTC